MDARALGVNYRVVEMMIEEEKYVPMVWMFEENVLGDVDKENVSK